MTAESASLDEAGAGRVSVARSGARSVVQEAFSLSPLRLLTPSNHGHAAWIFTSTFGGGLVDGDAIRMRARVGEGAAAVILTQSSTKVYRAERGASLTFDASVDAGGLLVVAPDPVVAFAGACYSQRQHLDLDPAASLVFVDWLTSGRRAAGERWAFRRYASRLTIDRGGRRILTDAMSLDAADLDVGSRMTRFNALGTLVLLGASVATFVPDLLGAVAASPVGARAPLITSAAPLDGDGCVIRFAAESVEAAARRLREQLSFLPFLLGDDPWSRKW